MKKRYKRKKIKRMQSTNEKIKMEEKEGGSKEKMNSQVKKKKNRESIKD